MVALLPVEVKTIRTRSDGQHPIAAPDLQLLHLRCKRGCPFQGLERNELFGGPARKVFEFTAYNAIRPVYTPEANDGAALLALIRPGGDEGEQRLRRRPTRRCDHGHVRRSRNHPNGEDRNRVRRRYPRREEPAPATDSTTSWAQASALDRDQAEPGCYHPVHHGPLRTSDHRMIMGRAAPGDGRCINRPGAPVRGARGAPEPQPKGSQWDGLQADRG